MVKPAFKLYIYIYIYIKEKEKGLIPKCFKIRKKLPGDQKSTEALLDQISLKCMDEEISKNLNKSRQFKQNFEKCKDKLFTLFEEERGKEEIERVSKYMENLRLKKANIHRKKIFRDKSNIDRSVRDLVTEDGERENPSLGRGSSCGDSEWIN